MLTITRRTFLAGVLAALGAAVVRPPASAAAPRSPLDDILGESPAISALRDSARELLRSLAGQRPLPPILIVGETGSGKELLGDVIHRAGPRCGMPFVPVCLAAIPEMLLGPELFGWVAPARKRATRGRPGLLNAAHQGTLLMSNVDVLSADFLAALVKTIHSGAVRRVNGAQRDPADVWFMTTAYPETATAVAAPLRRIVLRVPPLRERGDDVLLLADHYLARYSREYQRPAPMLSRRARAALQAYPWPGNVRELMNVMERALLLAEDGAELDDLGL